MKKLSLILLLTLGLTTALNANTKNFAVGDVFFCETIEDVEWVWDENRLKKYKLEKFKFSIVDQKTIKFGTGSSFENYEISIFDMFGRYLHALIVIANNP